jgi:large subunit ribosomal protein L29
MKIAELRAKGKDELKDLVLSLKQEQFNLRFQEATGALENKKRFTEVRKTIARAKTLMNEKPGAVKPAKAAKAPKTEKTTEKVAKEPKAKKAPAKKEKKG